MKTNNMMIENSKGAIESSTYSQIENAVSSSQLSYFELDIIPVRQVDLVEQLNKNLAQLQDIHARLNFSMREISYLMKI